jgi:hypothetical protein
LAYLGTNSLPFDPTRSNLSYETFSGNNSNTTFALTRSVGNSADLEVFVENVQQEPGIAYEASGKTLTFTEAPPTGSGNIYVVYRAYPIPFASIPDNSVTYQKLAENIRSLITDNFVGDGSNTTFTLSEVAPTANSVLVTIDGVTQNPILNYTVSNNTITFGSAPPNTSNVSVRHIGFRTSVTVSRIQDGTTIQNPTINSATVNNATINDPTINGTVSNVSLDSPTITGNGTASFASMISPIGGGFRNMEVFTTGTENTWSLPASIQVNGGRFKVTLVGGGGQGGGTSTVAGQTGSGGGSGGVVVHFFDYVSGENSVTYTVGAGGSGAGTNATGNAGANTTVVYSSTTLTAGGGAGGSTHTGLTGGVGGVAIGGTLNLVGDSGDNGGVMAATSNYQGCGGDTPLGFGAGGEMPGTAAGAAGASGFNFGAGGSGGRNGTGTTARAGGAGTGGIVIIEY